MFTVRSEETAGEVSNGERTRNPNVGKFQGFLKRRISMRNKKKKKKKES